ncbi:uncharacterized protein G2W53_029149 [Senna tora]|uniref:Uncharacterized protein n=1 Tax=Senna tora TaxID=362788 RepID=A0A834W9D4_9FABA|nr:uncharacterized protein G2W53_029149 [Senna tora]
MGHRFWLKLVGLTRVMTRSSALRSFEIIWIGLVPGSTHPSWSEILNTGFN